jgi:hypothetical protein
MDPNPLSKALKNEITKMALSSKEAMSLKTLNYKKTLLKYIITPLPGNTQNIGKPIN